MQIKNEATDLLSLVQGKTAGANPEENLLQGGELGNNEFGELLDKASGKLSDEDPNESLLKLMASDNPEELIKPESMGKITKDVKPMSEQELNDKLEVFGKENPLKTEMPGFQSHDKLTSPELVKQLKLDQVQPELAKEAEALAGEKVKTVNPKSESLELKDILNKSEAKNQSVALKGEVKQEAAPAINPLKKVNSQPSSDFIDQLKTAQSDKVAIVNNQEMKNLKMKNAQATQSPQLTKAMAKKPQVSLYGKEQNNINKSLISVKGDLESKESTSQTAKGETSQQNLMNLLEQADGKLSEKVQAPRPVVDLSSIKAENKVELINKISNYIEQSNIANTDNVDVLVRHDELGTFQISAKKGTAGADMVDLKINTLSDNGRSFFVENEGELLKSLNQNGIKVSDFKVSSGKDFIGMTDMKGQSFERSFSDNNSSNQGQSNQKGFSQNFSGREDSERRRNLWQQFNEYQQAYA